MAGWSVVTLVALLVLPWFSATEASHFRGSVIMFEPDPSNDTTIRFAFRMAFRRSSYSYYCNQSIKDSGQLLGSGGYWNRECTNYTGNPLCYSTNVASTGFHCTDFSIVEDWSMGENNFTYTFPANVYNLWTVSYTSCCWISLTKGGNSAWILSTVVNLTRRADTGEINSSPITTNQAIVRLREGCAQSIRIPLEDPDGDLVRCRWSHYYESYRTRDTFPHATLDEATCTLTYHGGSGSAGTYAVALTLEDFPAGTTDFANAVPFSSVGLQFLVIISASHSGSCDSKPVFTGSTPQDGQCAEIQTGSAYTATIEVTHVDHSQQIVELTTSSPSGMYFSPLSRNGLVYSSNITWYPSQYQAGKQVYCFKAVDYSGIESETRCGTILVGLSYTPHVIPGSEQPRYPTSNFGPGVFWSSIKFDRPIKKPRSASYIRLVLRTTGHLIYKVNALSSHVSISYNQTVLYFAMPFAALSMTGSYAILIDPGAVVGLGCSYDGPPTPGVSSTSQWGFYVYGICNPGHYLAPPAFNYCTDVDECQAAHPRSRRNNGWPPWAFSSTISPTSTYSEATSVYPSATSSPPVPWECQNYMQLTNGNRHVTYDSRNGTLNCDNVITPGWYRFTGAAGTRMPESCTDAPEYGCGTHAAGWLNGSHPDVADGALTYRVCYHWVSLCCWQSNYIQVRNCSGFYVYNLIQTGCSYRYCGMHGNESIAQSTSSSVAASCDFDSGLCSGWSQSFNDIFDWTLNSGSTSSSSTGPSSDHSGSGGYMYIEASSPRVNGDNAKLELSVPVSGSAFCLTFYYHMYGANMGTLNVYNGNTLIFTKSGDQGNIWIQATMTLYLQGNVIFEGVVGSSFQSDIAIDDVSITNGSCADYRIRLVNGAGINEGRVEININGTWGTICDDSWGIQDANVVCRMLNYSGALSANLSASFGAGSGRIWLDDVRCQGNESSIVDCPHSGIGSHNCVHGEDAGVVCATQQQQTSTITPVPTTSSSFSPPSSSSSSDPNNFHLTGWSGSFSSPNHPFNYENRHYCTWLITVTTGFYVRLTFSYFDLEHGASYCPYDYVEIFDGNSTSSPRIVKRCGYHAQWCVHSSSNVLFVRFLTDGSVVHSGFFAHYETVYNRSGICHSATAATTYVTPMTSTEHGIHPTPSSSFYASSSINVQPPAEDFVLHLPADCAQVCSNTPGSFVCSCYNGFQLGFDGKTCLDINECQINNGGCSHHCINVPGSFYCDCPEGVTMAADNRSCVEPGVAVTCSDTSMTVSMEQRSFPFISIGNLNLRDPLCQANDNGTHFILTTPLNGCGTTHNESQDTLFFWNAVVANAVNIGNRGITRTHNFRLPFYCQYSRQKMLSLSFTPLNIVPHAEPGYGDLTFKLELYRSSSFNVPYNQNEFPIVKNLGENLYMMISVESSASLTVMAINMTATKDLSPDSSPQYTIIENGCSLDSAMGFQYDATSSRQQFILPAFRFFDDYDTIYIHVGAVACHAGSANSRCAQSCLINGGFGRKRREALQDEKKESTDKVWISGGPLIIKDVSKESGDSGQSSGQAALIGGVGAAGGLFVLAVVALVVLAVKYRIARLFMNRNKVGDLYTSQDENMSRRNAYVEPEDMMEKEDVL